MNHWLGPYGDLIYSVMRLVIGFQFWCHGAGKVFGMFGGRTRDLASLTGVAGLIEVVGGALIAVGLLTTYSAFICSGEMAFAYFLSHAPRGGWPIENGGEGPVLFCFIFLFIAAHGSGKWSLDTMLWGTKPLRTPSADSA